MNRSTTMWDDGYGRAPARPALLVRDLVVAALSCEESEKGRETGRPAA
ncbi:hypothetical protein [Streptomyces sp. NPDC001315]